MPPAIRVEKLGKSYRVGKTGGASVSLTPVRGVSSATLVVTGVDAVGAAASTELAIKVG